MERFESAGTPSALVYRGAARPAFGVILNAHLDVVAAPAAQFRPYREGDRLYARGAQDMKVAALAQALAFRELAGRVPYPLGLMLVTDEETGDPRGTLHQLNAGVTARFAVIGEASGLGIATECKGIAGVRLTAEGRSAHGAYPWRGDNALLKLNRAIDAILAAYPVPEPGGLAGHRERRPRPNPEPGTEPGARPGRGLAGHPLPRRGPRLGPQDPAAGRRLPGGLLRAGRHPRRRPDRPAAPR